MKNKSGTRKSGIGVMTRRFGEFTRADLVGIENRGAISRKRLHPGYKKWEH